MDFQGIHDRLRAIGAPGLQGVDEPRAPDPANKKDKGRAGDMRIRVIGTDKQGGTQDRLFRLTLR